MKLTITIIAAAIGWSAPMAAPAAAQDVQPYSESLNDSARQVRERMLRDATVNRHRGTAPRRGISAPRVVPVPTAAGRPRSTAATIPTSSSCTRSAPARGSSRFDYGGQRPRTPISSA